MFDPEFNPAPLVSIIITYYAQEKFIEQTVLSAKNQTYKNIEVIIVDDGSPKPVWPLIAHIDGIRVFRKNNEGCPAARNFGFRESGGQFLVFLDQDDLLQPDAVEAQIRALNQDHRAVLSFGAARLIDANGEEIRKPHTCRRRKNYLLMLLESNPIECVGGAMIRRSVFMSGFSTSHLPTSGSPTTTICTCGWPSLGPSSGTLIGSLTTASIHKTCRATKNGCLPERCMHWTRSRGTAIFRMRTAEESATVGNAGATHSGRRKTWFIKSRASISTSEQ